MNELRDIVLRLTREEFKRILKACKDAKLLGIAERLQNKWRDDDSPHGEFVSASSPGWTQSRRGDSRRA